VSLIEYKASHTLAKLHKDNSLVRAVVGPIGSGKSVAMVNELMMRALAQKPFEGVRYSKWGCFRNSYRELTDTTLKTFFDWVPKSMGVFLRRDMSFTMDVALPDKTILNLEVLFRAIDTAEDLGRVLSLDLTGAWLNEMRELPKESLEMVLGRTGRYPPSKLGGPSWYGVIGDTNPPDTDHWFYKLFEEKRPDKFNIFYQPSGLSEAAENVKNLPSDYYQNMILGKDQEWINVYVHGKYGFVTSGKPVYPEYNDDVHYTSNEILPVEQEPLWIGLDFGLTPAAVFAQYIAGQWRFIDELVSDRMGARNFGQELGKHLRKNYRGFAVEITGDPAGEQSAQTDENTPFEVLSNVGIDAHPAHTNDFSVRRETFANQMTKLTFDGKPGFIIGPKCKYLRRGCLGGYGLRRMQVSGEEKFVDMPDKRSKYSHVCDAGQYLLLGAGEDTEIIGNRKNWNVDLNQLNRAAG
jgi:hypothetical protein